MVMKEKRVKVKRRRLSIIKVLLILIIIYIIGYGTYHLFDVPIKNIYIFNETLHNRFLGDQEIIEQAKIDNYPSFLLTTNRSITKRLLKNLYVKDVRVEKRWFGKIHIYVTERKKLFYSNHDNKIILENKTKVDSESIYGLPVLVNYVPDTIYDYFVEKMNLVSEGVNIKISEIRYQPNEVDKERFLLTLTDGNYVYLTLYTFEKINEYNKILPTLENKRGILYLDSGNYFEIIK
jgi:cell division septal protein FtsQ